MSDSDVEMLAEDFEVLNCTPEMDVVFDLMAESEDEYHSWRYKVHTCFCRSEDCVSCAVRDCLKHDPNHYHHDGCPECATESTTSTFTCNGVQYYLTIHR